MQRALILGRELDYSDEKRVWLAASHSDGQGGITTSGARHWIVFACYVLGVDPFPPAHLMQVYSWCLRYEGWLEDCMIWVYRTRPTGRAVSIKSCGKYASEARGCYRRIRQARLGLATDASRIPDLVKGCSRVCPQPPPLERWGVSPEQLATAWLATNASRMWRACTATALVGIMRGCEVVLMAGESFDTAQHLVPADVAIEGRGPTRDELRVRLRMRKRKDLRVLHGKHDRVVLAAAAEGAFFDVVSELEAWLAERRALGISDACPLFCHPDGSAATVKELCSQVKALMAAIGLDPARFGAHSLRIGGASAALAAGVPPALIRIMGRWSSDIYEIYCRMSLQSAMGVGRAIASAVVDPMQQESGFSTEELEMLKSEVHEAYGSVPESDETMPGCEEAHGE
jgi:hypothetical protein